MQGRRKESTLPNFFLKETANAFSLRRAARLSEFFSFFFFLASRLASYILSKALGNKIIFKKVHEPGHSVEVEVHKGQMGVVFQLTLGYCLARQHAMSQLAHASFPVHLIGLQKLFPRRVVPEQPDWEVFGHQQAIFQLPLKLVDAIHVVDWQLQVNMSWEAVDGRMTFCPSLVPIDDDDAPPTGLRASLYRT